MTTQITALAKILQTGIIAIMRAQSSEQLLAAADAILAGGVDVIEVTMTTPRAYQCSNKCPARPGLGLDVRRLPCVHQEHNGSLADE